MKVMPPKQIPDLANRLYISFPQDKFSAKAVEEWAARVSVYGLNFGVDFRQQTIIIEGGLDPNPNSHFKQSVASICLGVLKNVESEFYQVCSDRPARFWTERFSMLVDRCNDFYSGHGFSFNLG